MLNKDFTKTHALISRKILNKIIIDFQKEIEDGITLGADDYQIGQLETLNEIIKRYDDYIFNCK